MLYQYSTGIVSSGKIAFPLRELLRKLRNLELVLAEVTGIDAERRRVLARRPQGEQILPRAPAAQRRPDTGPPDPPQPQR